MGTFPDTTDTTMEVQGHSFALKGYTPQNVAMLAQKDAEYQARLQDADDKYDEFDYYLDIWRVIADGPHDSLDKEAVEGRSMEAMIYSFIPPSRRAAIMLTGFYE